MTPGAVTAGATSGELRSGDIVTVTGPLRDVTFEYKTRHRVRADVARTIVSATIEGELSEQQVAYPTAILGDGNDAIECRFEYTEASSVTAIPKGHTATFQCRFGEINPTSQRPLLRVCTVL